MKPHYRLAVIGGGPAGLAAAATAAAHDIDVALFDEQPGIGGQIYRCIESVPDDRARLLGDDYQRGKKLAAAFRGSRADYFPSTQVWSLNRHREIGLLHESKAAMVTADQVLVCSGAIERPLPFPGWTLPGVMNAGAGQILFKSSDVVPSDGVVLAGSGPLLLLLAWQYLNAGVEIKGLLDVTPILNHLRALPKLPRALLARHYLTKGLAFKRDLKRAGIKTWHGASDLRAEGGEMLEAVRFRYLGREQVIETPLLLTHFGVIPHIWLTRAAGCEHRWDNCQQCWRPRHDEWGNTSLEGILVAGDGAGINGARSAEHAGRLAAIQALYALGKLTGEQRRQMSAADRKWMRDERHIRPFLEAFFTVPKNILATPDDETVVCRCEEITAGQIRSAVAKGHGDSNQVKFLARCGMGPCQGRQCADAVAHITAEAGGKTVVETDHYRGRPPVTPLTLGQLATLFPEEPR